YMVVKQDKQKAIAEEKAKSQTDSNNTTIVAKNVGENTVITNLKVSDKIPLESFAMGQNIKFGAISGTIHFLDSKDNDNSVTETKGTGKTAEVQKNSFDAMKLTPLQATKFIIAHQAGSREIQELRDNEYSNHELTEITKEYQTGLG